MSAALPAVADVDCSPVQAENWALLSMFRKLRSGPRLVATRHCLGLMIRLVQQVRDCWVSGLDAGVRGRILGVRDALCPLAENGLSADGCGVCAQICLCGKGCRSLAVLHGTDWKLAEAVAM